MLIPNAAPKSKRPYCKSCFYQPRDFWAPYWSTKIEKNAQMSTVISFAAMACLPGTGHGLTLTSGPCMLAQPRTSAAASCAKHVRVKQYDRTDTILLSPTFSASQFYRQARTTGLGWAPRRVRLLVLASLCLREPRWPGQELVCPHAIVRHRHPHPHTTLSYHYFAESTATTTFSSTITTLSTSTSTPISTTATSFTATTSSSLESCSKPRSHLGHHRVFAAQTWRGTPSKVLTVCSPYYVFQLYIVVLWHNESLELRKSRRVDPN